MHAALFHRDFEASRCRDLQAETLKRQHDNDGSGRTAPIGRTQPAQIEGQAGRSCPFYVRAMSIAGLMSCGQRCSHRGLHTVEERSHVIGGGGGEEMRAVTGARSYGERCIHQGPRVYEVGTPQPRQSLLARPSQALFVRAMQRMPILAFGRANTRETMIFRHHLLVISCNIAAPSVTCRERVEVWYAPHEFLLRALGRSSNFFLCNTLVFWLFFVPCLFSY